MNVVNIHIPPLRERKEEIPIFVEYFLDKFRKKYNKEVKPLQEQITTLLQQYDWSGNVRELENVIHRYIVLGNEEAMIEELEPLMSKDQSEKKRSLTPVFKARLSLKEIQHQAVLKAESEVICKVLAQMNWNRKKSAKLLNISYKALLYKIKECGIRKQSTPQ
jgi:transcriptional regulator with PAS, ATPase and Fis domain